MALDLAKLKTKLEPPADGELGMSTIDPRFQDIVGQVQNGQFGEAAAAIQGVIGGGVYDIRLFGYYFYGVFLEKGLASLSEIVECLSGVLRDSWDAVGPLKKKERHAGNALLWFFTRVLKKLQYEQDKNTPHWTVWTQRVSSEDAEKAIELVEGFRRIMGPVLEAPKVLVLLPKIASWLREFQKLVYQPEPEPVVEAEVPAGEESVAAAPTQGAAAAAPAVAAAPAGTPVAQGSFLLHQLLEKLEAFDQVGEREEFEKAAVIAADVNQLLEEFDPRKYFPHLFAKYYARLAGIIGDMETHLDDEDSLRWKYLSQLYNVDLDAFVKLKLQ